MLMGQASSDVKSSRASSNISSTASDRVSERKTDNKEKEGFLVTKLPFLKKTQLPETSKLIRQQFTEARLWFIIVAATVPMVVMEICAIVLFPPELVLVLNEEESVGRCK